MTFWTITPAARDAADQIQANARRVFTAVGFGQVATAPTVEATRLQLRMVREQCDRLDRELGVAFANA